jgi:hypothetical protein
LFEGFFIRGAIVKGKLYHDEKMVFGEALVEAYRLENNVVNYPRVMVVRDVVQDAKDLWNEGYKEQLRQAEDGPYYLHVLRALQNDIGRELLNNKDVNAEHSDQLAYYVEIARQIQKRFNEAVDNPQHFKKVQWFARYWNDIVCEHPVQGLNRIKGAGLDPKPASWGY